MFRSVVVLLSLLVAVVISREVIIVRVCDNGWPGCSSNCDTFRVFEDKCYYNKTDFNAAMTFRCNAFPQCFSATPVSPYDPNCKQAVPSMPEEFFPCNLCYPPWKTMCSESNISAMSCGSPELHQCESCGRYLEGTLGECAVEPPGGWRIGSSYFPCWMVHWHVFDVWNATHPCSGPSEFNPQGSGICVTNVFTPKEESFSFMCEQDTHAVASTRNVPEAPWSVLTRVAAARAAQRRHLKRP